MRLSNGRALPLIAGVAVIGLLAACSSSTGTAGAEATASTTPTGPVTIDVWDWNAEAGPQVAAAFNAAQKKIKVNYVLQPDVKATQTNVRNAITAKSGIPCLVRGIFPASTLVANQWAQDVTKYVKPYEDIVTAGALQTAKVANTYYGMPASPSAQFLIVNQAVYDANGVQVPTTWEGLVAAGEKLKGAGVNVMNLAGEDPSSLINLAMQGGAQWFKIDGDKWVVNLHDANTAKAVDVLQKLVDEKLVANQTYQDRPALYSYFDSGKMASLPTQWWSLAGLQTNFSASLGQWKAYDLPQFEGAKKFVTAGTANPSFVPVGCKNPEAAVTYQMWALTDPAGIEASRSKTTGAVELPGLLKDLKPYAAAIVPDKIFGANKDAATDVIIKAQQNVVGAFEQGPNQDAWFPELQDQWGKFVAGQITLKSALATVEAFIQSDLTAKGISSEIAH